MEEFIRFIASLNEPDEQGVCYFQSNEYAFGMGTVTIQDLINKAQELLSQTEPTTHDR